MKNKLLLIFFIMTLQTLFLSSQPTAPDIYKPSIGDEVVLITRRFKNFKLNEVKDFFKKQILDNLKNQDVIQHTFILQSTLPNYLLVISFASHGKENGGIESDIMSKEYKSGITALATTLNFKVIALNEENYFAKVGDKMILWDYNVKNKNKEDVIVHFKNVVYPLLAKDEFMRDSYLIVQKNLNIFVGITMLSGKYKESKIVSEKLKEINKYLEKPAKVKVYDIIGVYEK